MWLTTGKTAQRLDCSTRTIRRYIESGKLIARRRASGRYEVRAYEVARFEQARNAKRNVK